MDLLARIDAWGERAPRHLAHVGDGRFLTYGDLRRRSDALASEIARRIPDDGSPVVVSGHKEPEMLIAFLGAVKAGHPYAPVDASVPEQRLRRIVEGSGSRLVLTPAEVGDLSCADTSRPPRSLEVSDPYYVMFTSGSTGEPKGVVVTLGCLNTFLEWMLAEHSLEEQGETFLNQAPFSFDLSVMDLYLSLLTGGTLFSLTRDQIASFRRLYKGLADSCATTWVSTPSFAQLCLAERTFDQTMLPRLRRFLFCGEALPPSVASSLLDRFPLAEVWNTYGPTEATVATSSIQVDREVLARYSPLPIGRAMPAARILLLDAAGEAVPSGERGEIVIVGPNVSPGYLGRPDLSACAFSSIDGQRAYRTGDWGHEQDGLLFCDGRLDNQVKVHGYRIELGDVESNLRLEQDVRDAAVLPVLKHGRADSLAAFVVLARPRAGSESEVSRALSARLAERLPGYMVPRRFCFVEQLPLTANGKVDRRALAVQLI